jgi:hypothetical protein
MLIVSGDKKKDLKQTLLLGLKVLAIQGFTISIFHQYNSTVEGLGFYPAF